MGDLSDDLMRLATEKMRAISDRREELVTAWIAENGVPPSGAVLCVQDTPDGGTRTWVEPRPDVVPELVSALNGLLAATDPKHVGERHAWHHSGRDCSPENSPCVTCVARAALAKAEGR